MLSSDDAASQPYNPVNPHNTGNTFNQALFREEIFHLELSLYHPFNGMTISTFDGLRVSASVLTEAKLKWAGVRLPSRSSAVSEYAMIGAD